MLMSDVVKLNTNYRPGIYDYPELMTVKEVKEYLRIGTNAVYEILHHHKCPSIRFGRKIFVKRDELVPFIDEYFHL